MRAALAGPLSGRPPLRWGTSLAIVLALHVIAVAAILNVHQATPPAPALPPAIMIELPPAPPPRPAPPKPVQPVQPVRQQVAQAPPKPIQPPVVPHAPLAHHVDVPLPRRPLSRPVQHALAQAPARPLADAPSSAPAADAPQQQAAPAAPAAQPAATAAPPATTAAPAAPPGNPNAVPTWMGALSAKLLRMKQYPSSAQFRHQQGAASVRITIDRRGNVVAATLETSSGVGVLDQETLALAHRVSPLPPPPPEIKDDPVVVVVPVQFFIKP